MLFYAFEIRWSKLGEENILCICLCGTQTLFPVPDSTFTAQRAYIFFFLIFVFLCLFVLTHLRKLFSSYKAACVPAGTVGCRKEGLEQH